MICPLLKYTDMQTAMAELPEVFQLQIVWLGDAVTEVRWSGGVAVAQTDQPEALHGSHIGHGWIYVQASGNPCATWATEVRADSVPVGSTPHKPALPPEAPSPVSAGPNVCSSP